MYAVYLSVLCHPARHMASLEGLEERLCILDNFLSVERRFLNLSSLKVTVPIVEHTYVFMEHPIIRDNNNV